MPKFPKNLAQRRNTFFFRAKVDGKEHWESLGTNDYGEACDRVEVMKVEWGCEVAERKRAQLTKRAAGSAAPKEARPKTTGELLNLWVEVDVPRQRNEKGTELAKTRMAAYLLPYWSQKPLRKVRKEDVRQFADHLKTRPRARLLRDKEGAPRVCPLSTQTQVHVLSDLRRAFTFAVQQEWLAASPFPGDIMPRVPKRTPPRLSNEEIALVEAMPEPWGFVARFALGTGLRWAELVSVSMRDVQERVLVVEAPKTGTVRWVPLPPALAAEVAARSGAVVPWPMGWSASQVYNHAVRQMRSLSGLPSLRPHQFRHTFACVWLERGGSLAALQDLLGHSTVVVTQRYGRLNHDALKREAEQVWDAGGNGGNRAVARVV